MIRYKKVLVQISKVHSQPLEVPEWEVPVLRAVHVTGDGGTDSVTELEDTLKEREAPDATSEFQRLATKYGRSETEDGAKGLPYVAAVYGQFGVGTKRLGDAINAAVVAKADDNEGFVTADPTAGLLSSVGG